MDYITNSELDKITRRRPQWVVADSERIPPLDHGARRQVKITWGLSLTMLGVAYFVGGDFWPFFLIASGILIVLWGHLPNLLAAEREKQIVADVPYQRK